MPEDSIQITGGITQALLDALDQVHTAIAAGLVNTDGSPSNTAIYMHLPEGQPIDPKMYSNPWTPAGGSAYGAVTSTGAFATAAPPPPPEGTPLTPAGQLSAIPEPDPKLQLAINSAFNTSQRVDNMLMVTKTGKAVAWPQRTVSIAYFTALTGMQAEPIPEPSEDIQRRIDEAQRTLYLMDGDGNFTGYTPRYSSYRHNQKVLADARSDFALAYSQAMSNPVQGQAWPVTSSRYQNAVDEAYNDLKAMGGQEIEDAIATLQSVGGSAAAALIAKARKMLDEYSVGLGGAVAIKVPWSYIDPVSWWDATNKDFGVKRITAESSQYKARGASNRTSFANSFYRDTASSTSASGGFKAFGFGASAKATHASTSHQDGSSASRSSWSSQQDTSSSATVTFEWFMATIERPWLLGDLFHMDGWYLAGHAKHAISDGTIDGQLGDAPKLLPMIPKSFLIIRNVTIEADSWGSLGSQFQTAMDSTNNQTGSSSTSYGGKVGMFGFSGQAQRSRTSSSGAFASQSRASEGWSFTRNGEGGKLEIFGSQIAGWVGQIQPASPRKDDPAHAAKEPEPAPVDAQDQSPA